MVSSFRRVTRVWVLVVCFLEKVKIIIERDDLIEI